MFVMHAEMSAKSTNMNTVSVVPKRASPVRSLAELWRLKMLEYL
jgi:hypothetical protein